VVVVVTTGAPSGRYEAAILPHLDAAHNLAVYITGSIPDADDVVQDACLRALRYLASFVGTDGRAWFLAIVRNVALDRVRREAVHRPLSLDDVPEEWLRVEAPELTDDSNVELRLDALAAAVRSLPIEFREVLVLREFEQLSYAEIAAITGVARGTVMSRLSRARARLRTLLTAVAPRTGP
jgi:RNA polymerase sigma factor (sigma-70 family)